MSFAKGMVTGAALVAGTMLIMGAARPTRFGTIDVERINVREKDGRLRLVIASRDAFPGAFENGREIPRPDRKEFAGMLLLNDEGTENGGFIWNGSKDAKGQVSAGASLTFDRYRNDQTLQLLQTDEGERDMSALILSDRPAQPLDWAATERAAKMPEGKEQEAALRAAGIGGATRVFVGRSRDRSSVVMLKDKDGKARLALRVTADGAATIDFLDENGKVVKSLKPE